MKNTDASWKNDFTIVNEVFPNNIFNNTNKSISMESKTEAEKVEINDEIKLIIKIIKYQPMLLKRVKTLIFFRF